MWYMVYEVATGRGVSLTTTLRAIPEGMASKEVGEVQPVGVWNPATLVFDPPPVPKSDAARFADAWTRVVQVMGSDADYAALSAANKQLARVIVRAVGVFVVELTSEGIG